MRLRQGPDRNRFRDAAVWQDRTALERLARDAKGSRLGHVAHARTPLQRALELAGRASPEQIPGVEWPAMASADFVEFELLRREAEELINPKSKEKPDKK